MHHFAKRTHLTAVFATTVRRFVAVDIKLAGEATDATASREVLEETGLLVTSCGLLVGFDEPITHTHVFAVQVNGEVKGSWEGEPRWVSCQNCRPTSIWRTGRFSHY